MGAAIAIGILAIIVIGILLIPNSPPPGGKKGDRHYSASDVQAIYERFNYIDRNWDLVQTGIEGNSDGVHRWLRYVKGDVRNLLDYIHELESVTPAPDGGDEVK